MCFQDVLPGLATRGNQDYGTVHIEFDIVVVSGICGGGGWNQPNMDRLPCFYCTLVQMLPKKPRKQKDNKTCKHSHEGTRT